jgi:hypothetical protein
MPDGTGVLLATHPAGTDIAGSLHADLLKIGFTLCCRGRAGQNGRRFGYSANVSLVELPPPGGMGAGWPGVELVIHELLGEIAGMEVGCAVAVWCCTVRLLVSSVLGRAQPSR